MFPLKKFFIALLFLFCVQSWLQGIALGSDEPDCEVHSNKTCKECVEVSGCNYCEPTKRCASGSLVDSTLHKKCEGQQWKVGQCLRIALGSDEPDCEAHSNKTCKECVEVSGCHYCEPTKRCASGSLVDSTLNKACPGQEWKVGQCLISGKVLLIALPVAGFVLLVVMGCTIYCCCCRKKKKRGPGKEEAKFRRQREEIEIKHSERRAERQKKHDDIRKKYGLYRKDDSEEVEDGRYHQFDNTAVA